LVLVATQITITMRFYISAPLVFTRLLLALPAHVVKAQDAPLECLTSVDPDTDYFVHKVEPVDSKLWNISYHNTYKIISSDPSFSSYLLYYCGSTPPEEELDGRHAAVVEIPIKTIAVGHNPAVASLEELGIQGKDISYLFTDPVSVYSPCLLESIANGETTVAASIEEQDVIVVQEADNPSMVSFISPFQFTLLPSVLIDDFFEESNLEIYEWVKFYSAFFNLEERANQVFEAAQNQFECVANAARITEAYLPTTPVILWASFSLFCGGWDVILCPDYNCELVEACSVELLSSSGGSILGCGGFDEAKPLLTTAEFVEFGRNADIWIFPESNWDAVYESLGNDLAEMAAVQNQQVFDIQKKGEIAWTEERYARYYDVVQDICAVAGTTREFSEGGWLRNVFTDPVESAGVCVVGEDKSALKYNNECENLTLDIVTQIPITSAPTSVLVESSLPPTAQPSPATEASMAPTPAPSSPPNATMAPSSPPVGTMAPSSPPVETMAPSSPPIGTMAPSSTPVGTMAPSSPPVGTMAPSSTPNATTAAPSLGSRTNAPSFFATSAGCMVAAQNMGLLGIVLVLVQFFF
jgi:ABC-type Fe3+-hydroxamate transport system substrate-binding protein